MVIHRTRCSPDYVKPREPYYSRASYIRAPYRAGCNFFSNSYSWMPRWSYWHRPAVVIEPHARIVSSTSTLVDIAVVGAALAIFAITVFSIPQGGLSPYCYIEEVCDRVNLWGEQICHLEEVCRY